jgi:hypothetical protein
VFSVYLGIHAKVGAIGLSGWARKITSTIVTDLARDTFCTTRATVFSIYLSIHTETRAMSLFRRTRDFTFTIIADLTE